MEVPDGNRLRLLYNSFAPAELQLLLAFHAGEGGLRSTEREVLCETFGVAPAELRAMARQLWARLRAVGALAGTNNWPESTVPTAVAQEYPG